MIHVSVCWLLLTGLVPFGSRAASGDDAHPAGASEPTQVSAGDFDWRSMLPYLDKAAGLTDEEGIKELLENSMALRAYVAQGLEGQCRPGAQGCGTTAGEGAPSAAVTEKIDDMVHKEIYRHRNVTRVDLALTRQPFPFTFIAALKTKKHRDAYLVLYFAAKSYTAAQVLGKYGAPAEESVFGTASLCRYRLETNAYTARAAFTIDPTDGEVYRVAISLKRRHDRD